MFVVTGLLLVLSGCTSTSTVRFPEHRAATIAAPRGLDSFREDVQGKRVRVVFLNDSAVEGTVNYVGADSLTMHAPQQAYSLRSIKAVVREKAIRGALDGAGIGFLSGFGGGFLIGLSSGGSGMTIMSPAASAALGGTILGVLGVPVGAVIGVVRKHRRTWVFEHSKERTDTPPATSIHEGDYDPADSGD
ncbi:hypothetical protein CRI94_05470 [Longibacter salinarum]|uniref:Uncharacterized protein n=1 Tax=Longibacter salinarum TaxID=1850348 RepID=A0A2A8D0M2_9BACT|nr:hypothetical protein [Longibacter salinarum]PEN14476.1 hypothetical protein CRI94_05470 [Longibacter salinarum]